MASPEHPTPFRRLAGNPSNAIYGTVVVAGVLASESGGHESAAIIVGSIASTLVVFWLAHSYAHVLGGTIATATAGHDDLRRTLRAEWPIVESGLLPVAALVVARLVGGSRSGAILVALIVAVVELAGWAALSCRRLGLRGVRRIAYISLAGGLGVAMIALKVAIH